MHGVYKRISELVRGYLRVYMLDLREGDSGEFQEGKGREGEQRKDSGEGFVPSLCTSGP